MTRVKICGVRRAEDAELAAELGAAALGFVFWPDSPRFVDPYRVRPIVRALPPFVATVGVFVDQPVEYVIGVAGLLNLGAIQLHGAETIEPYAHSSYRLIKAVPVTDGFDVTGLARVPATVTILLDAHDPVKRGGTGLSPDNVRTAVELVHPYAIDVSSGVESSPGVKDPAKLRALFAALHAGRDASVKVEP
jgi:phosphoribosylanthranilate isomerase